MANEIDFERLTDFAGWDGHTNMIRATFHGIESWWQHLTPFPSVTFEDIRSYLETISNAITPPTYYYDFLDNICEVDRHTKDIVPIFDNEIYKRALGR